MIDDYKIELKMIWKTLKELIRREDTGKREIDNIDFEILEDVENRNIADRFNLYYIKSIEDIIKSTGENGGNRETIYITESNIVIENFELIHVCKLEHIVMGLTRKKRIEEGLNSDLLIACFHTIKGDLSKLINDSLKEGICPEG